MRSSADANSRGEFGDPDDTVARKRYWRLLNAVTDGIYQLGSDMRFVAVNDAFAATTGYTRSELLGEHVSLLLDDRFEIVWADETIGQYFGIDATEFIDTIQTFEEFWFEVVRRPPSGGKDA